MDLFLNEVVIGAIVYLLLTWAFTSKFVESKFDKIHKKIEDIEKKADARDDENEAYIRRLEVILQVYIQQFKLPSPYAADQTEIEKNPKSD